MFRVSGLSAGYRKGTPVLHDIELFVGTGEALGVVGRNGSGKTCLALTAMGTTMRMSGSIEVDGRLVQLLDPAARVSSGLSIVPEGRQLFTQLTVTENLRVAAYGAGRELSRTSLADIHRRFPVLAAKAQHRAGSLSGGEQQWLTIARALVQQPRVAILDEPTLGLSPVAIARLGEALVAILRAGDLALVVMEQNPALLKTLCQQIIVLDRGRVVATGPAETVEELVAPVVLGPS